jgi:hypothetical protein
VGEAFGRGGLWWEKPLVGEAFGRGGLWWEKPLVGVDFGGNGLIRGGRDYCILLIFLIRR